MASKRSRSRRRRHYKRTKRALMYAAGTSLTLGALICVGAVLAGNPSLLSIGAIYVVAGGVCLCVRYAISHLLAPTESGHRDGMALLLVLMLLAILVGAVTYALGSAHVALRNAQHAELRTLAQLSAVDAAWNALRDVAHRRLAPGENHNWTPPSGAPARVRVRSARDRVQVHVVSTTNAVTYTVYCEAQPQPDGGLRVTRWVEP